MSHSTHVGFNGPPACIDRAVPPCEYCLVRWPVSSAQGVVQIFTAVLRFRPPSRPEHPGPPSPSALVGVGHNEDSPTEMVCTDGGRRNALPLEAVPEVGQVGGNLVESVK